MGNNTERRIPVFGDLQISKYRQFDKDGSRLKNCIKVLEAAFEYADSCSSPYLLHVGDLYDTHANIATEVVNATVSSFDKMFKKHPDITFIAITGNHDQATKSLLGNPAVSALEHLETMFEDRFIRIDNSCYTMEEFDITVFGIPYYEYPEHYRKVLERISRAASKDESKQKLLLIHQTPTGLGNAMIPVDTDANDELYAPFDMVFDGHIHARQEIIPDKFWIVGNPIHRSLEDEGLEKGFMYFKPGNVKEVGFHSTRGLYPEFKRVRLSEGEEVPQEDGYYIIPEYEAKKVEETDDASIDEFGSNLNPSDLISNFWKQVDGEDEELLRVGISFLH